MEVREPSARYLAKAGYSCPPGYKQTEVGVIPEDWVVRALHSITDPNRPISYGIVQTGSLVPNGVRCLRVVDIHDGHINESDLITTSQSISNAYRRTILQSGDLVIPLRGKVGDVAQVGGSLAGCNLTRGLALIALRQGHSAPYCKQFIASPATRTRLMQSMNGSALQEIPISTLRAFEVALPSTLAEQQAIAEALSDADALIESLDQLLTKKRQIKQGAMQELLTGQKRLPGFSGGWSSKILKNLVQIPITDGPHLTPVFLDDGVPFLSVNNLVDNKLNFGGLRYISLEDHEIFSQKCKPRKGDLLLGKAASVGKVALVETDVEFNIWSPIALIRINDDNDARFLYYQFQSEGLLRQITLITNASSQGNIGMGEIEKLSFPLPLKAEQTAIATVLSDLDAEVAALEARLAKARLLKQGMMQELLTGRIRLV